MAEKTTINKWPKWPIEDIPNGDDLYYRIQKHYYEKNPDIIPNSSFRPIGDSMSADWSKYSTPAKAKNRARVPSDNRIVKINVENVRGIPLTVTHAPDFERKNRSHTKIFGLEDPSKAVLNEIRSKLAIISEWAI